MLKAHYVDDATQAERALITEHFSAIDDASLQAEVLAYLNK